MSSLQFGTSGLRGLVVDLDSAAASQWTTAFCQHLCRTGQSGSGTIKVGQDLRSSSPSIAKRVVMAIAENGFRAVDCGALPTPALALSAQTDGSAAIMVTGSHIPDDRNGLKFYAPKGEIDKADEAGIREAYAESSLEPTTMRSSMGSAVPEMETTAGQSYLARYREFFGSEALAGLTIGIYEQSSVARDLLGDALDSLGAKVIRFARAETFIPVDTEAHRPEDISLLNEFARTNAVDAIVSTDGDGDRPLVADEHGDIVRGDILGMLTAKHLGCSTIVTPVTSSSAIENLHGVSEVVRTKVGSPYVIAGLGEAARAEVAGALGFEANGGVLLGSPINRGHKQLDALKTRDALLPIICSLAEARNSEGSTLSALVASLRAGSTASNRLKNVAGVDSAKFLQRLASDHDFCDRLLTAIDCGTVRSVDELDGYRMILSDDVSVHYRPSGNAPELRCYVEAPSTRQAESILAVSLDFASSAMKTAQS